MVNLLSRIFHTLIFVLAMAGAPVLAQGSYPDGRILLIDFGHYAGLKSEKQRKQAIADMISDIEMFQDEAPANGDTIVLAPSGLNNVRQILRVRSGDLVSKALQTHRAFKKAANGTARQGALLDLNDIRPAIHNAISVLGLARPNRSGTRNIVDIHIFSPGWRISSRNQTQDLMGTNQATECVIERGPKVQRWPQHVIARFEFRMPEGVEVPSHSATAAFIGSVTGYSTDKPFIMDRGATGPLCELDIPKSSEAFIDPAMVDDLNCSADMQRRASSGEITFACRELAPNVPSVGANLARGPVALVLRPATAALKDPGLSGSLVGRTDFTVYVGAATISAGISASGLPPQVATQGTLTLEGGASCRKGQEGHLTFGSGNGAIFGVISRYYCAVAELSLGMIELK